MKLFILVFLLKHFLFLTTTADLLSGCPEPVSIFPCYCEEEDGDSEVFCNHLTTPEQIYQSVKGLKGHRIYKMTFFMNRIREPIKSDAFKHLAIERIVFENSTIIHTSPQFQGMGSHLRAINFRAIYNLENPLVSFELEHLEKLREITFEANRFNVLSSDWLKTSPKSLRSLTMEQNEIIFLGEEVFSKITSLTFLVLESNKLIAIKRSMFSNPAFSLRSINLNFNRIPSLPNDIFHEMPNLRKVELAGNRLRTLHAEIWLDIIPQLTELNVIDNPLECDSKLKWLYSTVRFPANFLGRCQEPEKLRGKYISELEYDDFS